MFLLLAVIGAFTNTAQFFESYLFAYLFWFNLAMGSLGLLILQHMTGGRWGYVISRSLEAGASTLPLFAVLFIPLLFGLESIYPWARPDEVAANEILQHKEAYLNATFFAVRAAFYFALWIALAYFLTRWSRELDRTNDPRLVRRMRVLAPIGAVLFVLSMTFAAVDWGMSLEPEWFSSIYGVLFMVSQALSTMAFNVIVLWQLRRFHPVSDVATHDRFHDLGKLMLAFTALWMYVTYSQYIIIWSGNLAEEAPYYVSRGYSSWGFIPPLLITGQFVLPLLLLFSRPIKRNAAYLGILAGLVFVMQLLQMFWLILPAFYPDGFTISWINIALILAFGGLWLGGYLYMYNRYPPLPLNDPRRALAFLGDAHAAHSEVATHTAAHTD
ncbi:MAG: hypothetical protein H7Y32_02475 [Chloroflexales bacterium]|nr:hypothetical protein [Chloroflexales bacterium]